MNSQEFEQRFDVLYNNITSNQAPGLNTYEKCIFLTKAQNEKVKNYFSANSTGNTLKEGFDDSAKRQADFSGLMLTTKCDVQPISGSIIGSLGDLELSRIDDRSTIFKFPNNVFVPINEVVYTNNNERLQVIPLRYNDYTLLMSKPYKRPLKYQAWRLFNSGIGGSQQEKYVEIIGGPNQVLNTYVIRYVRTPKPIIIGSLDGLTIDGYCFEGDLETYDELEGVKETKGCELDPIVHEEILQRAVELAKIAWAGNQEELAQTQLQMTAGARSE